MTRGCGHSGPETVDTVQGMTRDCGHSTDDQRLQTGDDQRLQTVQ
ncbi:unnamed protein product, partial [Staurois parvus]